METRIETLNATEVAKKIKVALKKRSRINWSVTRGTGTSRGWLTIHAPAKNRDDFGRMAPEFQQELQKLLGIRFISLTGQDVAACSSYYREYIDRAEGRTPSVIGKPYWD